MLTRKAREALKKMGGRVTTVREFLGLTLEEEAAIEKRVDAYIAEKKAKRATED